MPAEDYGQLDFGSYGDMHQFVDDVGIAAFLSGCAIGSALITVLLVSFGILRRDSDQRTERFGLASLVVSSSSLVSIFFSLGGWPCGLGHYLVSRRGLVVHSGLGQLRGLR